MRRPRRPRPGVRGASPGSSVSRTGGLRDLVENAHQRNGFQINAGARVMRMVAMLLMASMCGISCSRSTDDFQPETIVELERAALDPRGKGDHKRYFEC